MMPPVMSDAPHDASHDGGPFGRHVAVSLQKLLELLGIVEWAIITPNNVG